MLRRHAIVPFETAIALLLIVSGIAGVAHVGIIDPVSALLPSWEAAALNWMAVVTGMLMGAGVGLAARGSEMAGLLFLLAVILCRLILYGYYLGAHADFATTAVFDSAVIWAAVARLITLRNRQVLIRVHEGGIDARD